MYYTHQILSTRIIPSEDIMKNEAQWYNYPNALQPGLAGGGFIAVELIEVKLFLDCGK